jgi:hypothetical protein
MDFDFFTSRVFVHRLCDARIIPMMPIQGVSALFDARSDL